MLRLFVVTTAVRDPTVDGLVENVTVRDVVVAAVTVPTAPLLKTIVFREATGSKPRPAIVNVAEFAPRFAVLLVKAGMTLAICTAAPPATPLVVNVAVRLPADAGLVVNDTVRVFRVAAVTVPTAPLLKTRILRDATVSNAKPLIVIVVLLADRLAVLLVIAGMMVATCRAAPLSTPLVVTMAV